MTFRKPLVAGLAVAALMLSPLSGFAQDATTETPAEAPAVEAAPAEGSATDDVAAAVDGLASQNWLKVCDPLPDGQKACLMRQVILANGQFLGAFVLRDDPGQDSRLLATAAVPLGVILPFSLTWRIDNADVRRVPYIQCDTTACMAQLVVNEQYINSLKRGSKLTLTAKNRNGEDLVVEIDLAGFTATYDGDASLSFEQLQEQESGQNALEQVLQDRAEQLRQELSTDGTEAPAVEDVPAEDAEEAPAQ